MKNETKKRNSKNGTRYYLNLFFNAFKSVLIGSYLMAIFYCLTKLGVIDYTITSSPTELIVSFIMGILILGGINFKMQLKFNNLTKTERHKAFKAGKEKGYTEGYQNGYDKGYDEGYEKGYKVLKKPEKYIPIEEIKTNVPVERVK